MAEGATARIGYTRDADLDYEALVILDEPSGDTLEIQRSLAFDEQDVAAGEDTYCLVRGAAATYYGGVESWQVGAGAVTLRLSGEAASVLGLPVEVQIAVSAHDEELLSEHLTELVGPQ